MFWKNHKNQPLLKWQQQIENVSSTPTFCALPWVHLATRPNGDMRLCCSANASGAGVDHVVGIVKEESGRHANFGIDTPLQAWNNEYMRDVRVTMLDGRIPKSCTKCFNEESRGVSSKRIWETVHWINQGVEIPKLIEETSKEGNVPDKLVYLDLRLGHTCNLKCVMCSPHDSSQWVAEHKKIYPLFKHETLKQEMNWDKQSFNNFWHENPIFWEQLYSQIPNLKQIYFAGGEPLMIKEHKVFLEEIIRQGYADKIVVRYNTNGLLIDDDIINIWSKFSKVRVGISIDAIGDRNHYIRFPADWNTLVKNLHKMDNTPNNIQTSIATAIQILNIKHLPDFAKWKIEQKFKKINFERLMDNLLGGGGIFNMHLLYIPTFLNIQCLPLKDKKEIREKFLELKDWLYNNYTTDDEYWVHNSYGWKRWQAVLDFMDSKDNTHLLPAFKEYIEALDKSRSLNFKSTFPELEHLI